MNSRSLITHSLTAGLLVLGAGSVSAQQAPSVPAVSAAPAAAVAPTAAEIQAFITTPNAVLAQFPQGGPALQARIKALVEAAAAVGATELGQVMTTLQTLATTGELSASQVSALAQGATQAATTLAAAGNTGAQISIQTAIAGNGALGAAARQAAAQLPGQAQTASTTPIVPSSPPGSAIGGPGAGGTGSGGAGSSTGTGTGGAAGTGGGGGVSSGGGSFAGAPGSGGGSNDDDDDNETIDPSPITRG